MIKLSQIDHISEYVINVCKMDHIRPPLLSISHNLITLQNVISLNEIDHRFTVNPAGVINLSEFDHIRQCDQSALQHPRSDHSRSRRVIGLVEIDHI